MSIVGGGISKQPLKIVEVPLNKFKEEVIPHHQSIFDEHKALVLKLISSNTQQASKEVNNKKKYVKQLRDLMYELDTLRAQVEDEDLDKFDSKTLSLRKVILSLVTGYTDLENRVFTIIHQKEQDEADEEISKENCNPFEGVGQIQIQGNVGELKLKERQEVLTRVENLNKDVEDLHEAYVQLNEMVMEQKEDVEQIHESVESTNENVQSGLRQLVKAHKIKTAAYPVTGAFLGGIIGGPIGLVAGVKVGGLAALGCALVGYTGGTFFKKNHDSTETQIETTVVTNNDEPAQSDKKEI